MFYLGSLGGVGTDAGSAWTPARKESLWTDGDDDGSGGGGGLANACMGPIL